MMLIGRPTIISHRLLLHFIKFVPSSNYRQCLIGDEAIIRPPKNKKNKYIYTVVTGMQMIPMPMRTDEIALKPNLVESEIVPEENMLWSYCLTIQSVDQQCLTSRGHVAGTLLAFVLRNKSTKTLFWPSRLVSIILGIDGRTRKKDLSFKVTIGIPAERLIRNR